MTAIQPYEVLAALKSAANARKQRNLDIVHGVCEGLHRLGSRDFSISTVGRKSQELGGVSKDALYNRTSVDYRTLIGAWAKWSGSGMAKPTIPLRPLKEEDMLLKIPDPAVRAVFGAIVAERNRLRSEINLLKSQAEIVIDRRGWNGHTVPTVGGSTPGQAPASSILTAMEAEAVRKAISPQFLMDEGWREGQRGEIVNDRGRVLFDIGFVPALKKLTRA
ncbi:gamma-mobile-trio protein GmtX [Paraburkholderia tropica]|uniref:gamma-mobile-trio protein GmtX n=1 Tax=Paraburkholderia tropica TaxID=92647 RepID=UPI002AB6AE1D|nr:gamma-mobile-trio protein GmtX [Paraburkholderia tropica]